MEKNKTRIVVNVILTCVMVASLVASVILFSLLYENLGALLSFFAFILLLILIAINISAKGSKPVIKRNFVLEKENENTIIGKFYDPTINYEVAVQQANDNKELEELEEAWQMSIDSLREQIDLFEGQVITAETEEDKLRIKARLQPMYEQLKVGESFIGRFNTVNNLSLLKQLYRQGTFVSLEEAEELRKKYDTILFTQTSEYKGLKIASTTITVILDIIFVPVFMLFLGVLAETLTGTSPFTYSDAFGIGFYLFWFGSIITLPVAGFMMFFVIPYFVSKSLLGDDIPEADIKAAKRNAAIGITASAIAGGIIHHHIKKNKKEYK